MLSTQHIINTSMKLCVSLFLVTATTVIADGHADICSTQFNWWYKIADNLGPEGYPKQTAKEKLMMLAMDAGISESEMPSTCKMQQNANEYYDHFEKILRKINGLPEDAFAPGFGFPFQSSNGGKSYNGLSPLCDAANSKFQQQEVKNNNGGPSASCAYGYPGTKDPVPTKNVVLDSSQFDNVKSLCRLKIFGFDKEDGLELQWCITDILGTMKVGNAAGYYDGKGSDPSKTPDLKCSVQTTFQDANAVSGNAINPPYDGEAYPTTTLGSVKLGPNPGGLPVFITTYSSNDPTYLLKPLKNFTQNSPNDPYQSFPILFRQLADQKVAGLCDDCEECVYEISRKYKYTKSRDFCEQAGLCKSSKGSKKKGKKSKIVIRN